MKLATISGQFGFATTTDLSALIADPSVELPLTTENRGHPPAARQRLRRRPATAMATWSS
jgi:hypothetical protein